MRKGFNRRIVGNHIPVKKETLKNLLAPLSKKEGHRANTWVPIIMNVQKDGATPVPPISPSATPTFTPTQTPTLTPTLTLTPTPSQIITYYLLAESGDILQAENNDLIEYEH
jgi:hypothetical protein